MATDAQILNALRRTKGDRRRAAKRLKMHPTTLYRRLRRMPLRLVPLVPLSPAARRGVDPVWVAFIDAGRAGPLRDHLATRYLYLVDRTAGHLAARTPDSVTVEDLRSAGHVGLMQALDLYSPARRVKFATHAAYRIRGAMLDELRDLDTASRLRRSRLSRAAAAREDLQKRLGHPPTDEELGDEVGPENVPAPEPHTHHAETEVPHQRTGNRNLLIRDLLAASASPLRPAAFFERLTRGLDFQSRVVLYLVHVMGHTMKFSGQVLNLSESRVSQINSLGVVELRRLRQRDAEWAAYRDQFSPHPKGPK